MSTTVYFTFFVVGVQLPLEITSGNSEETLAAHRNPKKSAEVFFVFAIHFEIKSTEGG